MGKIGNVANTIKRVCVYVQKFDAAEFVSWERQKRGHKLLKRAIEIFITFQIWTEQAKFAFPKKKCQQLSANGFLRSYLHRSILSCSSILEIGVISHFWMEILLFATVVFSQNHP